MLSKKSNFHQENQSGQRSTKLLFIHIIVRIKSISLKNQVLYRFKHLLIHTYITTINNFCDLLVDKPEMMIFSASRYFSRSRYNVKNQLRQTTMKPEPQSEQELLARARDIAGLTFKELADEANMPTPVDLRRDKGWVGQLLEWHLGATAGSKPQQDFERLGIELKTIPVGYNGKPLETTFVCVAPLIGVHGLSWQQSHVRNKLSRILWVPVEGEREIPLAERRVGSPLIWSPSHIEEQQLQTDWEELMELIVLGQVEKITARHGEVLQIRPKAANSRALTDAYGASGKMIKTLPRGFYLRTQFTAEILKQHFS